MKCLLLMMLVALLLLGPTACADKNESTEAAASSEAETPAEKADEEAAQAGDEEYVAASRAAAAKLGGALKTALQAAMKDGGPSQALNVCHDEAEFIAQQICDEEGLIVGRTSLKVRNPGNEAEDWEMEGLEDLAARMAAGEPAENLEMWTTVTDAGGGRTFRYLKAIPTAPVCLKCHGSDLDPELSAQLAELYPDDQATGFAAGDLRGAFTVTIALPR